MASAYSLHKTYWKFRNDMELVYPIPPVLLAARFVIAEASEVMSEVTCFDATTSFLVARHVVVKAGAVMDSVTRIGNGYKRNNVKTATLHEELADLAMMLMLLAGPGDDYNGLDVEFTPNNWVSYDYVVLKAFDVAKSVIKGTSKHRIEYGGGESDPPFGHEAMSLVHQIGCLPGFDIVAEIDKKFSNIRSSTGV